MTSEEVGGQRLGVYFMCALLTANFGNPQIRTNIFIGSMSCVIRTNYAPLESVIRTECRNVGNDGDMLDLTQSNVGWSCCLGLQGAQPPFPQ